MSPASQLVALFTPSPPTSTDPETTHAASLFLLILATVVTMALVQSCSGYTLPWTLAIQAHYLVPCCLSTRLGITAPLEWIQRDTCTSLRPAKRLPHFASCTSQCTGAFRVTARSDLSTSTTLAIPCGQVRTYCFSSDNLNYFVEGCYMNPCNLCRHEWHHHPLSASNCGRHDTQCLGRNGDTQPQRLLGLGWLVWCQRRPDRRWVGSVSRLVLVVW
jgi:hypothetical protein